MRERIVKTALKTERNKRLQGDVEGLAKIHHGLVLLAKDLDLSLNAQNLINIEKNSRLYFSKDAPMSIGLFQENYTENEITSNIPSFLLWDENSGRLKEYKKTNLEITGTRIITQNTTLAFKTNSGSAFILKSFASEPQRIYITGSDYLNLGGPFLLLRAHVVKSTYYNASLIIREDKGNQNYVTIYSNTRITGTFRAPITLNVAVYSTTGILGVSIYGLYSVVFEVVFGSI